MLIAKSSLVDLFFFCHQLVSTQLRSGLGILVPSAWHDPQTGTSFPSRCPVVVSDQYVIFVVFQLYYGCIHNVCDWCQPCYGLEADIRWSVRWTKDLRNVLIPCSVWVPCTSRCGVSLKCCGRCNFLPLLFVNVASVAFISNNVANVCLKTFYSANGVKHFTLVASSG